MSSKHRDLLVTNALAILLGLAASGLLLLFLGKNPVTTMLTLFGSLFRDRYTFADIFVKATPLMFMALAFGLPFQANLYNIGAQGQFYIGSVTAVGLSLLLMDNIPGPLVLVVVALASMVTGGLWGGLIGWLKARFNANEFLVSMMSTYVALNFMNYMLRTFLMETKGEYPQTDPLVKSAWLPIFVPGTRLHIGFILAVLACIGRRVGFTVQDAIGLQDSRSRPEQRRSRAGRDQLQAALRDDILHRRSAGRHGRLH